MRKVDIKHRLRQLDEMYLKQKGLKFILFLNRLRKFTKNIDKIIATVIH